MERLKYHDILYDDRQIGPWPTDKLKRVDKPTNEIVGPIERRDERESPFGKSLFGEYGEEIEREFKRMTRRYPLGASFWDMQDLVNNAVLRKLNPVAPERAPIPDDPRVLSRHVKLLGHFLGADLVGIGPLSQSAVYTHNMKGREIEAPYKYAIVLLARKHEPTLYASNGWEEIVDPASFQAYQRLAMQTETMANYMRRLGFEAEASNMNRYMTLMPQVVLDAGLGEVSRMGIILNPFLGGNFKAACVLTNMELETDGYIDFGLQDYCGKCTLCAEQCPARAITRGPKTLYNGYYTWKLEQQGLLRLRRAQQGRLRVRAVHQDLPLARALRRAPRLRGVGRQHRMAAQAGRRAEGAGRRQRLRRSHRGDRQVVVPAGRGRRQAGVLRRQELAEDLPGVPAAEVGSA